MCFPFFSIQWPSLKYSHEFSSNLKHFILRMKPLIHNDRKRSGKRIISLLKVPLRALSQQEWGMEGKIIFHQDVCGGGGHFFLIQNQLQTKTFLACVVWVFAQLKRKGSFFKFTYRFSPLSAGSKKNQTIPGVTPSCKSLREGAKPLAKEEAH